MNTTHASHEEVAALLERVRQAVAPATARADEIDRLGAIPVDLYEAVEDTGIFQSLTPKEYGGLGLTLTQVNDALVEGARANGSLGWVMMIHIQQSLALGIHPKDTVLKVLAEHPRPRIRGAAAPKGTAIRKDGGYVVSGRWPFASGGPSPHHVGANCIVSDGNGPIMGPDGIPELVIAWVPAADVEFLDTWHVLGLRGSDSRDFSIADVFVPEEMTSALFTATNFFETPAARLPLRVALAPGHAAVAIGIAKGALDEITALAPDKRSAMNPTARLAEDPGFQQELGESVLRLAAAEALLRETTTEVERIAASGRPLTPAETMTGRGMTGFITRECTKVVDTVYTHAGSASLYDDSPLQRRLRDIHVASQHISTTPEVSRHLGATLVGEELSHFELVF